jgi:2-polyprenyl-3-methyl-5-hydroxy-6-metoxy-1,4-benzoquinol methylase
MEKKEKKDSSFNMALVDYSFSGYRKLEFHRMLLQDSVRTNSFRKAIMKVVKKGDTVVDLGAGTGILSFFACQAGAKKIYAIEQGNIIKAAKNIALKNKMADRIVFINENSRIINLPEKIDVIISECIGPYVFGGNMISAVTDMRDRFLKKGGRIIPSRISMFLVPVQSQLHYSYLNFWKQNRPYGIDLSPAQKMANNNVYTAAINARHFISDPKKIADMDFLKDRPNEMLDIKIDFPISKPCRMHGMCGWFEVDLHEKISFSALKSRKLMHRNWWPAFFPLEKEILLKKDSIIKVHLALKRSEDDSCACFNWNVTTVHPDDSRKRVITRQSTRKSFPFDFKEECAKKICDTGIDGKQRNRQLEAMARYMRWQTKKGGSNE